MEKEKIFHDKHLKLRRLWFMFFFCKAPTSRAGWWVKPSEAPLLVLAFFAVEYLLASCQKMLFANMPETGRVNIPRLDKQFVKRIHGWVLHFPSHFFQRLLFVWSSVNVWFAPYPILSIIVRQTKQSSSNTRRKKNSYFSLWLACCVFPFEKVSGSLKI